jgi:hypothetical protein
MNVEVTEPFWFRDEFGEDSTGRYVCPGNSLKYDDENNECYVWGRHGFTSQNTLHLKERQLLLSRREIRVLRQIVIPV